MGVGPGLRRTVDWDLSMGGNQSQLEIPRMMLYMVPHWAIGIGRLWWWWRRHRHHRAEDPRLALRISQILVLEEVADAMNLKLQSLDLLLNLGAARL
jgi:hypothetical protein